MKTFTAVLFLLAFFIYSCKDGDDDDVPATNEVRMNANSFLPSVLTVPAGTTVRWINNSSVDHTVTSDDNLFHQLLRPGNDYSYTFSDVGTYGYVCTIHIGMAGTISVE